MRFLARGVLLCLLGGVCAVFVACSGDSFSTVTVSGRATFPPEFAGTLGEVVPVSNTSFQVLDLNRSGDKQIVATGSTTSDGVYAVTVPVTFSAAVVVLGQVRVSGLVDLRNGSVEKNFNGITDVACESGVTAISDGAISAEDLDSRRIDILERAAAMVLQDFTVDFTNSDGSRSEAVRRVRELTHNGDSLP